MARFRYCLNASTIKPTPLLEKIAIAGEVGYAGIELWHDDIDAYLAEGGTLSDVRKALADLNLAVPTTIMLKGWCETDETARADALQECRRRLAQAAELGAPHSIAGPPHGEVDLHHAADCYRQLLEEGRRFGVLPAMEYLGFARRINTIDDAITIMDRAGDPQATIVLDPFHDFRGGGGHEAVARLRPKQIAVSHFNDAPAQPPRDQQSDPDRVLPGEGIVDLKRYLERLEQIGYDGWLSLELFRQDLWQRDPREVARLGLERMQAVAES